LIKPQIREVSLARQQHARKAGIFACDGFVLYSNLTLYLDSAGTMATKRIAGDLSAPYGGKWHIALVADIFVKVWAAIGAAKKYTNYDWVAKVDADTVFFPERLRALLIREPFLDATRPSDDGCASAPCAAGQPGAQTCRGYVTWSQEQSGSCSKALESAASSCSCACGTASCREGGREMYIMNCKHGLHGPLEVLSRQAVQRLTSRLHECDLLRQKPWGEDRFLFNCLDLLGVRRANEYKLLLAEPGKCSRDTSAARACASANVAFHPYKTPEAFARCWSNAMRSDAWAKAITP